MCAQKRKTENQKERTKITGVLKVCLGLCLHRARKNQRRKQHKEHLEDVWYTREARCERGKYGDEIKRMKEINQFRRNIGETTGEKRKNRLTVPKNYYANNIKVFDSGC